MPKVTLLAILAVVLVLAVSTPLTGAQSDSPRDPGCGSNTAYDPRSDSCAKVTDRSDEFPANQVSTPSLETLRGGQGPGGASNPGDGGVPDPDPGGDFAGTTYKNGSLSAATQGSLYTVMFIHGDGIGDLPTSGWIFTTSTNRIDKGVEVVGVYDPGHYMQGKLGIFDWSCSASDPCSGGYTSEAWIWQQPLSNFRCNMTTETNGSTHFRKMLYYNNSSTKLDRQNPPLWENKVLLWNYCNSGWDNIYTHQYRVNQDNCSGGTCRAGWWGPILEVPTSGTETTMWELGFKDTWLLHDGEWSALPSSETDWWPELSPWSLFYRVANRTWSMGNWY